MPRLRCQASLAGALAVLVGSPTLLHGGVRAEKDTVDAGFSIASGGQIETLNRSTFIRSVCGTSTTSTASVSSLGKALYPNCCEWNEPEGTSFTQQSPAVSCCACAAGFLEI